jgi:hypothetical protein
MILRINSINSFVFVTGLKFVFCEVDYQHYSDERPADPGQCDAQNGAHTSEVNIKQVTFPSDILNRQNNNLD